MIGSAIPIPTFDATDDNTSVTEDVSTDFVSDVVPIREDVALPIIAASVLCVFVVGCKKVIDGETVVLKSVATENESELIGVAVDFTIGIVCSTRLMLSESFVTEFAFINAGSSVTTTPSHSSESQTRFVLVAPLHSIVLFSQLKRQQCQQ